LANVAVKGVMNDDAYYGMLESFLNQRGGGKTDNAAELESLLVPTGLERYTPSGLATVGGVRGLREEEEV
jgi:hypothetical protein